MVCNHPKDVICSACPRKPKPPDRRGVEVGPRLPWAGILMRCQDYPGCTRPEAHKGPHRVEPTSEDADAERYVVNKIAEAIMAKALGEDGT